MKKEYIIGGLSLIGVIALITYFKKPKRNSEGFFNVGGMNSPKPPTNLFGFPISPRPPITPKPISTDCNLPDTFVRRIYTNGGLKSYCGRYARVLYGNKPFIYTLQPDLNQKFYNGFFYNSNNQRIITNSITMISNLDFENAFRASEKC